MRQAHDDNRLEPAEFEGHIDRTVATSVPSWPRPRSARGPNVVIILLDDVGFAQLGCYGSSIATPHMDALAAGGVQYTDFHATALCSPTRACLLTGRNHHSVGMGFLAAFDTGYPSYRGQVSVRAATLAEILRDAGYGTYASGKWHLTPPPQLSPAGPFHQWPTQRGFDRYYGFLGGEEDQWAPELWYDQHAVDPPTDNGYHLSEDLVAHAKEFIGDHVSARPDDPFFLYLAFGACHAPHQAPRRFIDEYRGKFDHGWDVERERVLARQIERGIVPSSTDLTPRNPGVRAWTDLDEAHRQVYARMQEVFAGFLSHTDAQVGALLHFLSEHGLLDDTLVVLMSDNGASAEGGESGSTNEYRWFLDLPDPFEDSLAACDRLGGPGLHNHYPTGWAQAGNTPGKFYKRFADGGGVRVPCIVHWPGGGIDTSTSIRTQFHHVIDIAPTVLEVCGINAPSRYRGVDQLPLHGTSMAYSFADAGAESTHGAQYFETAGYRGVIANGWKAIARHTPGEDFDADHWELYHLADDFSECHDVSGQHADKAAELEKLWWREAERYGVLPLDDRMRSRVGASNPKTDRLRYEMLPGARLLNAVAGPNFSTREFTITAEIEPWQAGHDGVLLAWGRTSHGLSFFVDDGRLTFDFNLGGKHTVVAADADIAAGSTTLEAAVREHGDRSSCTLRADGRVIAEGQLPRLLPAGMGPLSTKCGFDAPLPVSAAYSAPNRYRGSLHRVVIALEPHDTAQAGLADWRAEMARQ